MDKYKEYLKREDILKKSLKWNDLPNGQKYMNDTFAISPAHCKLSLMRAGQQYCGGQNYWDAPPELCEAVLKVICQDKTIINRALELLKKHKDNGLKDCKQEISDILAKIDSVDDDDAPEN